MVPLFNALKSFRYNCIFRKNTFTLFEILVIIFLLCMQDVSVRSESRCRVKFRMFITVIQVSTDNNKVL